MDIEKVKQFKEDILKISVLELRDKELMEEIHDLHHALIDIVMLITPSKRPFKLKLPQ
jgi:hypothetical protein